MTSIDGPSDFTENMFEYMKGNKQPTAKKSSRVKSKVKPNLRRHLKEDESGIIIASASEFGDDTTNHMIRNQAMPSPAKSENSELDGPSDFTANIVDYMRGNKAYSPAAKALSRVIDAGATKSASPIHEKSVFNGSEAYSPLARTSPPVTTYTTQGTVPKHESADHDVSKPCSPSGRTLPKQSITNNTNKKISPALEKVVHTGNTTNDLPSTRDSIEPVGSKTTKPSTQLDKSASKGGKSTSQPRFPSSSRAVDNDPSPLPKMNKNLVINGPSNFTASLAAYINGTSKNCASVRTTSYSKPTARPMSSPAKVEHFHVNCPSDFTANLADHSNGTKKESGTAISSFISKKHGQTEVEKPSPAVKTTPVSKQTNKTNISSNHDDDDEYEVEGPSDFTENLVDYVKGTKTYSPPTKLSSSAATGIAKGTGSMDKASSNAREDDLCTQIAQLQSELMQKDETIDGLRLSLAATEKKSKSESEEKNTTIDKLQTSLKQSHQQCRDLESELHQVKMEVDDLQENLNVSAKPDPGCSEQGADGHAKDVILNTVQHKDRVINRLHHNNETLSGHIADLRAEIGDKDLLLIEEVEEIRKPQSESDCELLKEALSKYADDLNIQHDISDKLAAEKNDLEATILSIQKRQAELEKKQKEREEEWQARVALLMQEIERRGAACMHLWGQLEHPGEQDKKGRQKYTYKYTKKSTRGAPNC